MKKVVPLCLTLALAATQVRPAAAQARHQEPSPALATRPLPASVAMPVVRVEPHDSRFWVASAAALVGAALLDRDARDYAIQHRRTVLGRAAATVGPVGRAKVCVPTLAVSYVAARLLAGRAVSSAVLHVAAGYVAADAVESLLKPLVGRERPFLRGDPGAFHPLTGNGDYHSFPSAHTVHAMAIAAGVAAEIHQPVVAAAAYGAAGLVAAARVYGDWHWTSDVVASTILAVAISHTTIRFLEPARSRRPDAVGGAAKTHADGLRPHVRIGAGGIRVTVPM